MAEFGAERDAVRVVAPVGLVELHAVPGSCRAAEQFVQTHALALVARCRAARRRAMSRLTKRCTSACFSTSVQSNQLISLSWQ